MKDEDFIIDLICDAAKYTADEKKALSVFDWLYAYSRMTDTRANNIAEFAGHKKIVCLALKWLLNEDKLTADIACNLIKNSKHKELLYIIYWHLVLHDKLTVKVASLASSDVSNEVRTHALEWLELNKKEGD